MSTNRRLTDLTDYASVLPYASEIFGIYQPLLGWKSERIRRRFQNGFQMDKKSALSRLKAQFAGLVDVQYGPEHQVHISMKPGSLISAQGRTHDSIVVSSIAALLPPHDTYQPAVWSKVLTAKRMELIFQKSVVPTYSKQYSEWCSGKAGRVATASVHVAPEGQRALFLKAFESQLRHESSLAGTLLHLAHHRDFTDLERIFYNVTDNALRADELLSILSAQEFIDGYLHLETLDPHDREHIRRVALSPISVVHLFRQYFFELDTFLGSPVSHVWLSPGSNVELIEIQTRRTIVEKTLETSLETTSRTESEITEQDEIADAVKEDNKQDIKFGASVTASYASVTATASFDYATSQQTAREQTHKRMREQTEKLSTEIRKNFKSTFKTVTETTDMSSKRYFLTNSTEELINYELRRKMRQVAVQVQDIGTYLCWQTYVDRPGKSLGVANLMHIAKPAELDGIPAPEEIPMLQPFTESRMVTIPFISVGDTDADNENEVYKDGVEVDNTEGLFGSAGELELIQSDFPMEFVCPRGNYVLTNVEFDGQGKPVTASRRSEISNAGNKASFVLHLDSADFQGQNSIQVQLNLYWSPGEGANDEAIKKNKENVDAFKAKEVAAYQKAFVENAKERIKLTHQIKARSSEDLREEERIVVYRKLIQDMLMHGVPVPDDRTRHVVSELINSIFDVDKMLYFVAPEWWRPRYRAYVQQLEETDAAPPSYLAGLGADLRNTGKMMYTLGAKKKTSKLASSTVGWGGVEDPNRDNYYITEDSELARFGSSLGWLLQLDGDDMRNAFLNAPWVKAVIPIRPSKEEAAVNWLKGVEGFNGIGNADIYQTNNPNEKDIDGKPLNGQKMNDVIMDLARKIQKKHLEGIENGQFPKADEVADPALVDEENVVTTTPIDRVYEHGFYPLQGGFRANVTGNYEIFDQWLEILPTDQVVPVEVKYDPKTGRQL